MSFSPDRFRELPVVGILRGFPLEILPPLIEATMEGGLTTIEVTMNTPGAAEQIETITRLAGDRMNVGAGTVTTMDELEAALEAGASFIVTPIVVPEVVRRCVERQIPVFPGAFTPTEIFTAWQLGATMVKVFPANQLGPSYIKNVKAPLDQIDLLATGGVTVESLADYAAAGASGFGVGSPLFHQDRIAARDWPWVQQQAGRFREAWQAIADKQ